MGQKLRFTAYEYPIMMGRTHLLLGVNSVWLLTLVPGAVGSLTSDMHNPGLLTGLAALGGLLPDLDAAQSTIKFLGLGKSFQPFLLPAELLHRAFGHRGLLHSLLGLGGFSLLIALPIAFWIGWTAAIALILGYASHLLGDGCTKSGIPLWFPRPGRWHMLPPPLRLTTGSQAEDVVFMVLAGGTLALLLPRLLLPSGA